MKSIRFDTSRIELAFASAGCALLLVWGADVWVAHDYQARAARELDRWRSEHPTAVAVTEPGAPPRRLAPASMIGRLRIPRIGLTAMVAEGIGSGTLRRAVGHLPGSAYPGDPGRTILAGHRDTFFRGLQRVRRGDEVELTTREGPVEYRVASASIVPPRGTGVLTGGPDAQLTLITCYPFDYIGAAPLRFVVRAERIPVTSRAG